MAEAKSQDVEAPQNAAAPTVAPVPTDDKHKVWTTGTMTYTGAGLFALFFWLIWGDIAWTLKDRSVGASFQMMLIMFECPPMLWAILLTTIGPILSMIIIPIVSYKSDRYRSRWGRRVPFLLVSTPVMCMTLIGVALSPMLGGWLHSTLGDRSPGANASVLIFLSFFWVLYDVAAFVANPMFHAFVNDVVPRPLLGRFFAAFRMVSLAAGISFQFGVFGKIKTHYMAVFMGIGILLMVGLSLMCLMVKEGEYPPPPPPDETKRKKNKFSSKFSGAITYFRECFMSNPYYLWVFAAFTISNMACAPINNFNMPFAKSMGVRMEDFTAQDPGFITRLFQWNLTYGEAMALYFFCSLCFTFPIGWLVDKFHALRISMIALTLNSFVALWAGLFVASAKEFNTAFVLTGVLNGSFLTAHATLGPMLLPKARFSQYSSAAHLVHSLVAMALGPFLAWGLKGVATANYIAAHQTTGLLGFLNRLHMGWILTGPFGGQFRYTYLVAFFLHVAAIALLFVVFVKFKKYGGAKGYVAPD